MSKIDEAIDRMADVLVERFLERLVERLDESPPELAVTVRQAVAAKPKRASGLKALPPKTSGHGLDPNPEPIALSLLGSAGSTGLGSAELQKKLNLPKAAFRTLMLRLQSEQKVTRSGWARATRYSVP